jgi:hypothetical protein
MFFGQCFGDARKTKQEKKRPFVVEAKALSLILLIFNFYFSPPIHALGTQDPSETQTHWG